MFTAYGVGALVDALITGRLRDWLGTHSAAFVPLAGLALWGSPCRPPCCQGRARHPGAET